MVIQRINAETVGIKYSGATAQVRHGGAIRINDYQIEGPGEYDIADVGVHVFPAHAVLFGEGVRIAVVANGSETMEFEEGSEIDIFILFTDDGQRANAIIKEQDPRVVLLTSSTAAEHLKKEDGVTVTEQGNYKVTAQSLPSGEREIILLQ